MIKAIVCVDKNFAIGKNNDLLFHLSKDMQFFQERTKQAGFVVFGENTYLSLPKCPLKDRVNIVLCPEGHKYKDCICFHDFNKLIEFIQIIAKRFDVFICGGGQLYKSFLPYYDEVYITKVDADGKGTVFFPNLDKNPDFSLASQSIDFYENNLTFKFTTYTRKHN